MPRPVRPLCNRLGQTGLAIAGGVLMGLRYLTLALAAGLVARAARRCSAIGLGFYMLHNTLQTNATQMSPEARGTAVALFSSVFYSARRSAWRSAAPVIDRSGAAAAVPDRGAAAAGAGVLVRRDD